MNQSIKSRRVGILGGGQLACMLGEAATRLGLQPIFFLDDDQAPAARLFPSTLSGKKEPAALRQFLSEVPVVAFENEFVDCGALREASRGLPVRFAPDLSVIEDLQDKLRQKRLLQKLGIPSSPFLPLEPGTDAQAAIIQALNHFQGTCVLKWSRMGYDGKGVCVIEENASDLARATDFVNAAILRGIPVYAERRIHFKRELAMIGCRSHQGDFLAYPLVVSEQEKGICKKVSGPAVALGVPQSLEVQAAQACQKLAADISLVGSFALEFFEDEHGELLVNEIAPRVHNSGHYTQNACPASQFENHWRAILDLPLAKVRTAPAFAMLNLLGPEGVSGLASDYPLPEPGPNLHLHWYAKLELRPGRKLGHFNGTAASTSELSALLAEMVRCESTWIQALQRKQ